MHDWLRSLTVLGVGFVGVVTVVLGLAVVIAPGPAVSVQDTDPTPSEALAATGNIVADPTEVGGRLSVSGDIQEDFMLTHDTIDGRYGLEGDDARIFFVGDPPEIEQMNLGPLSFFPDPDECTITPGSLNAAIGVATAQLQCEEIADVRGNGVVTIIGTLRLAGDVVGLRGDLPLSGGEVDVADETLVFAEAYLFVERGQFVSPNAFAQRITTSDGASWLMFDYDPNSGVLTLSDVTLDGHHGTFIDLGEEGCPVATQEIGQLNPRVNVVELSFDCPAVDVEDLGSVVVRGSLIVEQTHSLD
ncbi:MAG: hypothetical protein ACR2I5_08020 [Candidatus Limnocylindria bacterium]